MGLLCIVLWNHTVAVLTPDLLTLSMFAQRMEILLHPAHIGHTATGHEHNLLVAVSRGISAVSIIAGALFSSYICAYPKHFADATLFVPSRGKATTLLPAITSNPPCLRA